MNYYNENDPKAAQWLRNLIQGGMIPKGDVDDRSITDVRAKELKGYTQCHFFAGIGGWSEALRLAGWPTDRPVWTGSCPCQSFSVAGKGKGFKDERHLWPAWFELIKECRPPVIFGEQVEAAIKHGWIDLVQDDLEGQDYAIAKIVLPACGIGAPHIRQRLWFMAYSDSDTVMGNTRSISGEKITGERGQLQDCNRLGAGRSTIGVAYSCGEGLEGRQPIECADQQFAGSDCLANKLDNTISDGQQQGREWDHREYDGIESCANVENGRVANTNINSNRKQITTSNGKAKTMAGISGPADGPTRIIGRTGTDMQVHGGVGLLHDHWGTTGFWRGADWICCTDGKSRPIEPGTLPLADGVSGRVVKIRGYGNAIVPQVAAEIIKIGMEYIQEHP